MHKLIRSSVAVFVLSLVAVGCSKKDEANKEGSGESNAAASAEPAAEAKSTEPPCKDDQNKKMTKDGKVSRCLLEKEFEIDGYKCDHKMLELHPDGKLKGCYLAEAKTVDGTLCKDGLSLYPDGKLRRCKAEGPRTVSDGVEVRKGDWVTFYKEGGIKRLELAKGPNKIQGVPCKGYFNYFHENGKLKKCELAEDTTIEGKKVEAKGKDKKTVYVCFDDKGKRVKDCSILTGMSPI